MAGSRRTRRSRRKASSMQPTFENTQAMTIEDKIEMLVSESLASLHTTDGTGLRSISESTTTTEFFTASEASEASSSHSGYSTCDPRASTSEYYSPRIESIRESMNRPGINKVEAEIETSKDHWTELPSRSSQSMPESLLLADEVQAKLEAAAVEELFERLQKEPWGYFFEKLDGKTLDYKLAEGGQAEIFLDKRRSGFAYKVFKRGTTLLDLLRQIPRGFFHRTVLSHAGDIVQHATHRCSVSRVILLQDGRVGFQMRLFGKDLRTYMDRIKMKENCHKLPPFSDEIAILCMVQIAKGMQFLHNDNNVHRDLKASNVLVFDFCGEQPWDRSILTDNKPHPFFCFVADFECSRGVVGTGFWRAPEVLYALKNREMKPELFTEKSDVYSYAMTCYEILTGLVPFEREGYRVSDYDVVLRGERPKLPGEIRLWVKELLTQCWHNEPSERPTFEQIVRHIDFMEPLLVYKYIDLIGLVHDHGHFWLME